MIIMNLQEANSDSTIPLLADQLIIELADQFQSDMELSKRIERAYLIADKINATRLLESIPYNRVLRLAKIYVHKQFRDVAKQQKDVLTQYKKGKTSKRTKKSPKKQAKTAKSSKTVVIDLSKTLAKYKSKPKQQSKPAKTPKKQTKQPEPPKAPKLFLLGESKKSAKAQKAPKEQHVEKVNNNTKHVTQRMQKALPKIALAVKEHGIRQKSKDKSKTYMILGAKYIPTELLDVYPTKDTRYEYRKRWKALGLGISPRNHNCVIYPKMAKLLAESLPEDA